MFDLYDGIIYCNAVSTGVFEPRTYSSGCWGCMLVAVGLLWCCEDCVVLLLLPLRLQYFYDQYLQQDMTAAEALASATCKRAPRFFPNAVFRVAASATAHFQPWPAIASTRCL